MVRNTILVIDDEKSNTDLIKMILEDEYKVITCNNGREALDYLTKNYKEVALIILDLVMPEIDGMVLLKVLNKKGITKLIPVIIMMEWSSPEKIQECYTNGAEDLINKPIIVPLIKGRVHNIINLHKTKLELESIINKKTESIKEQNKDLKNYNDKIVEVMSTVVEFRNLESGGHIKRIKEMSRLMADMVKRLYPNEYHLNDKDVDVIDSASALHDVGKIAISDSILLKPGRLTSDEFDVIKSHTTQGCEILNMIESFQEESYMKVSHNIVRYHHERYDGKGYPDGLSGEDIPIEAQIVSIVDAYEALVGERVYRDAFDKEKAFKMIINGECGAFSKNILDAFSKARPLLEKIADKYNIVD